ncbi:MAG: carbon-nitrogen hydrolase family protein [Planctomycetes bacterium]|nr:carbon-nitrogen hydrolase family protein [Planctomycetota bacterium]
MQSPFVAAAVQFSAGLDKQANLATATRLVREAASRGAQFVCLPELFNACGPHEALVPLAEPVPGPTSEEMRTLAAELKITLLAGSIAEQANLPDRMFNTSLLFGPDGDLLATYRKIHLFDVDVPGDATAPAVCVQESSHFQPGDNVIVADASFGRLGLSICYDLRFPELYRQHAAQQADVIAVPAAFTYTTGRDHWTTLLKARAIENQAFVVAANQCGGAPVRKYGHSQILGPWGETLAAAEDEAEAIVIATLDPQRLAEVRSRVPALAHRRIGAS